MSRRKKLLFAVMLIFLTARLAFPETQVSISSSASLATIGDQIDLKIIVKTGDDIHDIKISTAQKDFEIVKESALQKRREKSYTVFEKSITVAFFTIGEFEIEPFKIDLVKDARVIETRQTNSIPVTVKSVLAEEDKDIKPLKDPIALFGNPFFVLKYVLIILAAAGVIVFIVLWLRKRAKRPKAVVQPLLPPLEEFETEIEKLWSQRLFEKGMIKEFFVKITEISKRFLNRHYRFNAEDFTTYETLYYLGRKEHEVVILNNMKHLLDVADLVKFAKFIPQPRVPEEMRHRIDDMVSLYRRRQEQKRQAEQEIEIEKENEDAALRQ